MRAPALTDHTAPPPIAPRATGGTGAPGFPDALRMAQIRTTPADTPASLPDTPTVAPAQSPLAGEPLSTETAQQSGPEILNTEGLPSMESLPAPEPETVTLQ